VARFMLIVDDIIVSRPTKILPRDNDELASVNLRIFRQLKSDPIALTVSWAI
jgi:hypothetical protein